MNYHFAVLDVYFCIFIIIATNVVRRRINQETILYVGCVKKNFNRAYISFQEIELKIYTTPYFSHTYVMAVRYGFNLINHNTIAIAMQSWTKTKV